MPRYLARPILFIRHGFIGKPSLISIETFFKGNLAYSRHGLSVGFYGFQRKNKPFKANLAYIRQ